MRRWTLPLAVDLAPCLSWGSPLGSQARQQISKVLTSLADQWFQFVPQKQCQAAVNDSKILHFMTVPGLGISFCVKSSTDSLLRGSRLLSEWFQTISHKPCLFCQDKSSRSLLKGGKALQEANNSVTWTPLNHLSFKGMYDLKSLQQFGYLPSLISRHFKNVVHVQRKDSIVQLAQK